MADLLRMCWAVAGWETSLNLRSKAKLNTQCLLTDTSLCLFIPGADKADESIYGAPVRQV